MECFHCAGAVRADVAKPGLQERHAASRALGAPPRPAASEPSTDRSSKFGRWIAAAGPTLAAAAATVAAAAQAQRGQRGRRELQSRCRVALRAVQRRRLLTEAAVLAGGSALPRPTEAADLPSRTLDAPERQRKLLRLDGDKTSELVDIGDGRFPKDALRSMDVAILGEHHNQQSDHLMQADFVSAFAEAHGGRASLGLEMVEQPFQPVLDRFNAGELSVADLYDKTEWEKRWVWDFGLYSPIFEAARASNMPLVALNTQTEVQRVVPTQGMAALKSEDLGRYLPDRAGFAEMLRRPGFLDYAERVIMPSYNTHRTAGWLGSQDAAQATPQFFMLARVLRDEAMAVAAWRYLEDAPEGSSRPQSMVVLVGGDHVKFGYGMPDRLKRLYGGVQRFKVLDLPVALHAEPRPDSKVVGRLVSREVFEAGGIVDGQGKDGRGLKYRQLADGRGFALVEAGTGRQPSVTSLPGRKRSISTVVLNPTAYDALAFEGPPLLRLPLSGVPEKEWPKFADYIWYENQPDVRIA